MAMNDDKLVAVVRASDKSSTGFHVEQWKGARELRNGLRGGECFFFMNGRVGYRKLCWISCSHLMWHVKGGGVEVGCRVAIALKLSFVYFSTTVPFSYAFFSTTNLVSVLYL
jgi:hypothetical protein